MQDKFISCDWGTSSFRLRLIKIAGNEVLAEVLSEQGIAVTYALWKEQETNNRVKFYTDFILMQIGMLQKKCSYPLNVLPVLISGMASSSIGMIEMPYQLIPVNLNDAALPVKVIEANECCDHKLIIISGLCTANDVMRGEETMLAGCSIETTTGEQLFIFPGTHSKQVVVENGVVTNFKTYMTGELFHLLTTKSILASSLEKNNDVGETLAIFIKGVKESTGSGLLNNLFHVRSGQLLNGLSKKDNYHFLSGLLIGEELKNIINETYQCITIVSTDTFFSLYTEALTALGFTGLVKQQNADEALTRGQALVYNKLYGNE